MKLSIKSDGSRRNTKVVTEQGEEIDDVTSIEWHYDRTKGETWAVLTIGDVPCDAVAGPTGESAGLESQIL